jgi:hypothetical protein
MVPVTWPYNFGDYGFAMEHQKGITGRHPQGIIWRNPIELRPHPIAKAIHRYSDEDIDFLAFCDAAKAGLLPIPALITHDDRILDGVDRWRVAKRQQVDLPCVVIDKDPKTDAEALKIVVSTLNNRRHYTPGQRALIVFPFIWDDYLAAQEARKQNLRKGQCFSVTASSGDGERGDFNKVSEITSFFGFSEDTLQRACAVHDTWLAYKDHKLRYSEEKLKELGLPPGEYTLREGFEPALMRKEKPIGLGAAVAGMASLIEANRLGHHAGTHGGGGLPIPPNRQLELWSEAMKTFRTRFTYWTDFSATARTAALKSVAETFESMPDDLLKATATRLETEMKRRKQAKVEAQTHARGHKAGQGDQA